MKRTILAGLSSLALLTLPAAAMAATNGPAAVIHANKPHAGKIATMHTGLHKAVWHRHKGETQGDREVNALNALEAAGYRTITDVHEDGRNVTADAMLSGKAHKVMVTPAGKVMPEA